MSSIAQDETQADVRLLLNDYSIEEQKMGAKCKDDDLDQTVNTSTTPIGGSEVVANFNKSIQSAKSITRPGKVISRSKNAATSQTIKVAPTVDYETVKGIARRTSRGRRKSGNAQAPDVVSDPVIEQWYTDPYNRFDPEGPADRQLRKQNITTALRNRGFRGPRVANVVNWLVRCKGQHKDYNDLAGRHYHRRARAKNATRDRSAGSKDRAGNPKRGRARKQACDSPATQSKNNEEMIDVENAARDDEGSGAKASPIHFCAYPSPASNSQDFDCGSSEAIDENYEDENKDRISNVYTNFGPDIASYNPISNPEFANDSDVDDNELASEPSAPLTEREAAALHQLHTSLQPKRPAFTSLHRPGTQDYKDDYDDWCLEALKRTQEFWTMIYGDDLDDGGGGSSAKKKAKKVKVKHEECDASEKRENAEDGQEEEGVGAKFTWFRDPGGLPTVDVRYRNQGLKPLSKVVYQGREVWAEDGTCGLSLPPKSQKASRQRPNGRR